MLIDERHQPWQSKMTTLRVVFDGVADGHEPVCKPVTETVAIKQRHHDVDIGFEL